MKNKFLLVALIGAILVAGLVLIGCGNCTNNGNCKWDGVNNSSGGVCTNTKECVIFDTDKGIESLANKTTIPCDC